MAPKIDSLDVLTALDLTQKIEKKAYETQLAKWQGRLSERFAIGFQETLVDPGL